MTFARQPRELAQRNVQAHPLIGRNRIAVGDVKHQLVLNVVTALLPDPIGTKVHQLDLEVSRRIRPPHINVEGIHVTHVQRLTGLNADVADPGVLLGRITTGQAHALRACDLVPICRPGRAPCRH